jgi:hypothetical protein
LVSSQYFLLSAVFFLIDVPVDNREQPDQFRASPFVKGRQPNWFLPENIHRGEWFWRKIFRPFLEGCQPVDDAYDWILPENFHPEEWNWQKNFRPMDHFFAKGDPQLVFFKNFLYISKKRKSKRDSKEIQKENHGNTRFGSSEILSEHQSSGSSAWSILENLKFSVFSILQRL